MDAARHALELDRQHLFSIRIQLSFYCYMHISDDKLALYMPQHLCIQERMATSFVLGHGLHSFSEQCVS